MSIRQRTRHVDSGSLDERSVAWAQRAMITCKSSKTRAESRPMGEMPMINFERGSSHTHGQAIALIATFYKASYSRLLALVRKGFRSLEPEEMVQELFVKILDQVDSISANDPEAMASLIEKWTTPGYTSRSLIHLCLDAVRSGPGSREDATDPQERAEVAGGDDLRMHPAYIDRLGNLLEYEPPGLYPQSPDQVPAHLATMTSRQAVNAILQALLERGRLRRGCRTHITQRQLDILVALYNSNKPATEESTELTDDELHKLTLEVDKRARARWRDIGGYSDPEAGSQVAAAAELGISRQAVSQSLKAVGAALSVTRYIAGVLAPPGTLLNPSAIHTHLDQFDQLRELPDGAKHYHVLIAAAPAVRTTADRGTRVQPALLNHPDHGSSYEQVEAVHAAETHLARLTRTSHPNCVNACDCHTQQLNRAIEL
jgi:DNA-directed RNA polymerase specialized sigma24 family protein